MQPAAVACRRRARRPGAAPSGWCCPARSGWTWPTRPRRRGSPCARRRHASPFALHRSTLEEQPARIWSQDELAGALADTVAAWRSWSALHQNYDGPWRDLVHHSGRVLQALTFQPTRRDRRRGHHVVAGDESAASATGTTATPGCATRASRWTALWVAACPDEASDFFAFMTTAAAAAVGPDTPLQIMFGVGGEHDLTERTLPHLAGWRNSRPVRVGNGAWSQQQIDVYGELLERRAPAGRPDHRARTTDTRAFLVGAGRHGRRAAGGNPTRASGRCAASPGTSCTRRSCAGSRSTGRSRWPAGSRRATGSMAGRPTRDEICADRCPGRLERRGRRVHPVLRFRRRSTRPT